MPIIIADYFKKKPIKHWVLLIIFVSFIAKVIIGYIIRDSFFHRGNAYHQLNAIAFNIANNLEYALKPGIPSIDYEPLYPVILALSYKLFGKSWLGVTLVQGILFGMTSWLLFLIGIKLKDELTGFVAASYHSFYPYLFFLGLSVVDTTQFIFIVILLIYIVIPTKKKNILFWHYVFIGSVLGICLLSRGSALLLLPPIILYLLFKSADYNRPKLILIVFGAALIVISPWIIRNYRYTKTFVISAHGGFGFWQGNNEFSSYYLKNNISLDKAYQRKPPPTIYKLNPIKARPPKETMKVAQIYKSAGYQFIKKNPSEFIKLSWLKFIKFWSWTYNPIASSYTYISSQMRQWVYFISYIPLLVSIPFGLYFLARKSPICLLLFLSIIVTYTGAHMIIMGYTRLRLPLDPILMLFFGIVFSTFYSKIKIKKHNS